MQYITDLHLHSKYSRAVSRDMILPLMSRIAKQKGIQILSMSDFTHPMWLKEVENLVEEAGEGIYKLSSELEHPPTKFICTTEISCIYKDRNKLRRIHSLVFAPSIQDAEKIQQELIRRGANVSSDGRPIIGLSVRELLELVMGVNDHSLLIPAHIWTPHFGLLGSASGYDSIEEAFGDLQKYIYGIETGLSSDPAMNWQIKELENRSILSFSDAHSPAKMGRELTAMELVIADYPSIREAIMFQSTSTTSIKSTTSTTGSFFARGTSDTRDTRDTRGTSRIVYTLEFYPEEGKYHYSGHRDCHVVLSPQEVAEKGLICPVCHRRLTEGVATRVSDLAGDTSERVIEKANEMGLCWYVDSKKQHPPYLRMVPLLEVIAESLKVGVTSKKVTALYQEMIERLGDELTILLKTPLETIREAYGVSLSESLRKVRSGDIVIHPGFDNVYGTVRIWEDAAGPEADSSQLPLL